MLVLRRVRHALGASRATLALSTRCTHHVDHFVALRSLGTVWMSRNGWIQFPHRAFHASCSVWQPEAPSPRTAKQKKSQLQWNVHRDIVVDKTPLPTVFERLQRELETRGPSIRMRQAIDVFYFNCAQQVTTLDAAFVAEVITYFEDSLLAPAKQHTQPLSESLNEGVFPAIVRLLLAQGNKQRAWEIAQETASIANGRLHFRSVGPILDYESRHGDFVEALTRWRLLKTQEIEWTKTMEDTLVQMIIACQRHYYNSLPADTADADMRELLRDLSLATREISPDNGSRLRHAFQTHGFIAKTLPDNQSVTPQCGACRTVLAKEGVSEAERLKLIRFIETNVQLKIKNATNTTKEFLVPFKRWLLAKHAKAQRHGKLHFILDGPNIAYLNQNFDNGSFRFDHVDRVVQMLQKEGHDVSITIPFSYLEETSKLYIRTRKAKAMRRRGHVITRQRSPEDKATIDRWRENNLLFSCRTDYLSDDIFWLYASTLLGEEARVVTNDQGRDHVFTLLDQRTSGMTTRDLRDENRISMDLLDRWRASVIVNIEIQHGELLPEQRLALEQHGTNSGVIIPIENVRLIHPTPFSRIPQISATGDLHFPIADTKGETTKWLCLQRPAVDN